MIPIRTSTTGAHGLSRNDCRHSLIFAARWKGGRLKLSQDFHELLEYFARHEVRFLIVGGWALAAHGYPRLTKDLDVWVWAEAANAQALLEALDEFGFGELGLRIEDFTEPDMVIQLGYPPNRVDLLTSPTGVDFETCWSDRRQGQRTPTRHHRCGDPRRRAGRPELAFRRAKTTPRGLRTRALTSAGRFRILPGAPDTAVQCLGGFVASNAVRRAICSLHFGNEVRSILGAGHAAWSVSGCRPGRGWPLAG